MHKQNDQKYISKPQTLLKFFISFPVVIFSLRQVYKN